MCKTYPAAVCRTDCGDEWRRCYLLLTGFSLCGHQRRMEEAERHHFRPQIVQWQRTSGVNHHSEPEVPLGVHNLILKGQ